ncbi:hypothetical protein [Pengzhenrongella phosphoraccumulans]|uniref:hypothetical protein n=1 Tax=Pengzhenrongella phosphoraccumulans TaxID=3114394 RepID=UPI003890570E
MPKRPKHILAGVLLSLAAVSLIVSFLFVQPRMVEASFSAREVGTASESQRRVLADGIVTLAEMNAAWESVRGCLQDASYSPGPIGAEGPGTGFTIEVDYTDEADPEAADRAFLRTHAECEDEYVTLVGRAYNDPER